jgi:hypothetical protein
MSKKLQKVFSVTTSVTTILWLSGVAAFAPMAALATTINEGDTIKVADNPDVYIAKYVGSKKFKRLILNPDVFNSYKHLSWSKIKTVTQAEQDAFTVSDLVRALGDAKVYKLTPNGDVGTKQWLNMTAEAFTAAGYDWDSIYVINNVDRDNYTTGTDITGGTVTSPVTSATPTTGGALTVSLASDTPAAGVAVGAAARVPFTKVNFTAGASDVTITGLTIQRTGLADDLAISSVTLVDSATNLLVGLSQTLNAVHQATITETITIPANTTKSYTLSANMPALATAASYAGQIATLSLVSVATTATVSGTLPITGNGQTINGTLTIGSATVTAGSLDPNVAADKEVGTTNYKFSAIKITAGSTENVTVYSIKWNQSGSAASSDLANIKVSDGTTDYATTISSDGKYYTASFGTTGIAIAKGLNKEFTVKGDIVGGSARTIAFDIYRNTDIMIKGDVYGYYLTPAFTASGTYAGHTTTVLQASASPYFAGSHVTAGTGSLRVEVNSTLAPSANVTEGAQGVVLGAFNFVVQGEAANVNGIILNFNFTGTGSTSDITNITLSKSDGTVLAGPVNGADTATADGDGTATFSGTVTFPVGTTQVIVKGNLNTDFATTDTFLVGFTNGPDAGVGTTSLTGATTGNTITASPTSAIWSGTMSIKAGALTLTVGGTPVAQTIVAGATGFTFTNYIFDATASGENIKVTSLKVLHGSSVTNTQSQITGITLYDGATALNTGSNVLTGTDSATAYSSSSETITLDNPLIIPKGTTKVIALKGNISASATAAIHGFGIADADASLVATGVSTSNTIDGSDSITAGYGQKMTVSSAGQYSIALDSSTPTGKLVVANTTGNVMTVLRFRATAEAINVDKLSLFLASASSTCNDLGTVYVYDGSTLLGSGLIGTANATGGTGTNTTFTLSPPLQILANEDKVVTIKADLSPIYTTATVATAGHLLAIDVNYDVTTTVNGGTGQSSGTRIGGFTTTAADTLQLTTGPAYIYKSVPTVTKQEVSTTKLVNGAMDLFKFRVAADAKGDIDLYKFTFRISTSVAKVGVLTLVDVTGGNETTLAASSSAEVQLVSKPCWTASTDDIDVVLYASPGTWDGTPTPRTVPAGTYKDFVLRGTITGATTAATVTTQMQGDSSMDQVGATYTTTAALVDGWTNDDFIWSDWSIASHAYTTADWTNGYLVSGLASSNTAPQTIAF